MAAGNTYSQIASTTVSSASNSLTFSSIPGTYTDLVLIINATSSSGVDVYSRLNSDANANYSSTYLNGTGSAANSGRLSNLSYLLLDSYGYVEVGAGQMMVAHFMNYSNTATNKPILTRPSNANNGVTALAGLWRSTAAITSITLYAGTGSATFSVGSTFNLYGIAAA